MQILKVKPVFFDWKSWRSKSLEKHISSMQNKQILTSKFLILYLFKIEMHVIKEGGIAQW